MNILLTGATGFIGGFLSQELLNSGHLIFAVTHQHPLAAPNRETFTWLYGDLAKPQAPLPPPPTQLEAVVHLAQSRDYREFPYKVKDIFNVNVNAVLKLLEYARQHGIKTFIYTSTANVYQLSYERISEACPLAPTSF
jgi:UDP-glucose 4-epimerase